MIFTVYLAAVLVLYPLSIAMIGITVAVVILQKLCTLSIAQKTP